MASVSFVISDVKSKDGRNGVQIRFNNDTAIYNLGGEPAMTAAHAVSMVVVEEARKLCDHMGFPIEEISGTLNDASS